MESSSPQSPIDVAAQKAAVQQFYLENADLFIEHYSKGSTVPLRLNPFQRLTLKEYATHSRIVLLMPATHGKSTLISMWYAIWRVCQNPNIRIIIVFKNDKEKGHYAKAIRNELSTNQMLIADFGPFKPKARDAKWSDEAIEVAGRQLKGVPQPTIEFASVNSIAQVLGHRCDEYILDDTVTPENINTLKLRNDWMDVFLDGIDKGPQYLWDINPDYDPSRPEDVFNKFFLTKPDNIYWPTDLRPYGQPIVYEKGGVMGTVFHTDDPYHRIGLPPQGLVPGKLYKGNVPPFVVLYWDCYVHDEDNNLTEEPLFYPRWTREKLLIEEGKGAQSFLRRMRNIAVDEGNVTFKNFWIKGDTIDGVEYPGVLDKYRQFGQMPEVPQDHKPDWFLSLGCDPSTGRKGTGYSFTAFVLLAVDMNAEVKKRYVIDLYREQIGYEDTLSWLLDGDSPRRIEGFYTRYTYQIAVVEKTSFNLSLINNTRREAFELNNPGVKVVGHDTQWGNKWDPLTGVGSMQAMIRDGNLSIPYQKPTDKEKARELINELALYPEGPTDDYVMALHFANLGIKDKRSKYRSWARTPHGFVENPHYTR